VPLTVLAPSEIVAVNPSIIRAPIEGVVEKILVKPNQVVSKGEILFFMDSLSQKNDLDIAQKVFMSLKVRYAQLARQALSDLTSKKFLSETLGQLKEQEIRIENLKQLIKRMKVLAPKGGSVIIDDPSSWEGRPVNLGERIVSLADQNLVEVESWLSVADVIDLKKGASVRLYLNSDPLAPISASLRTISYEAQQRPGDIFAHRIRAKILNTNLTPRLGLRGTARIVGKDVSIIYWILRRPISAFRQFFGF
jgi:multidrug efflux pump subunit AcrA (membrane-fusion protein)